MESWKSAAVRSIRSLALSHRVYLTDKCMEEVQILRRDLPGLVGSGELDEELVRDLLLGLQPRDARQRLASQHRLGGWLYVFKPEFHGRIVYLKVSLRTDCVVISLHEDR